MTWGISTKGHILYIIGVIQLLLFMRGEKKGTGFVLQNIFLLGY